MNSVNINSLRVSFNSSAMSLNQPSEIPGRLLFLMGDTNWSYSLRAPFMQIRHYCKPFVQLGVCHLMLAICEPVSLSEYIQPLFLSLVWGSCFLERWCSKRGLPIKLQLMIQNLSFVSSLPYNEFFGGVSGLTVEQFKKINGFPNAFWGWGGEDDDLWNR